MTERVPVEVTNLDRYGSAVLPWCTMSLGSYRSLGFR